MAARRPSGPTFLYARSGCVNIRSASSVNLESVFNCGLRSFRAACQLRDDMYCRPPSAVESVFDVKSM